ncbi:MAG: alpha/beta fold hydrolase [Acidimicrobiales bacterium]
MSKAPQSPKPRLSSGGRSIALGLAGTIGVVGVGYGALRAVSKRARGKLGTLEAPKKAPDELELPLATRYLDVPVRDGGSIHVADWGEGPPIVCLHGVTLQSSVWAYQFHDLGDSHRMIALDLRGHGRSIPGDGGMTIAAMADDLADVLESLDLRRVTLAGHSMGGMVILRMARRHPSVLSERVGAVAIIASAGGISPPLAAWHRLAPRAAGLVVAGHTALNKSGHSLIPGNTAAERGAHIVFGPHPDPAAVKKTLDLARSMRPDRFVSLLPELVGFDERAAFEDLEVACVVVVGDRDRVTPERYARALAATLPGSRLVVWPGAGHMLMYERREALDWLLDRLSVGTGQAAGGSRGLASK